MKKLPIDLDVLEIVEREFHDLYSGTLGLSSIRGGQSAADAALATLDIAHYAESRSQVLPLSARGASVLSPYIRHNMLTLKQVYRAVGKASFKDREKFRDELYWQEYARHLYGRLGTRLFENLRFEANREGQGAGWNRQMSCMDVVISELESDGWLVNQSRMWLASDWTVRNAGGWLTGQEIMYRNLIDGSRAANLLGWQWTVGAGTGKPYGFARWQVEKRAPGLCMKCPLSKSCPIENFPEEGVPRKLESEPLLDFDPHLEQSAGPRTVSTRRKATQVLITIDSFGDADPALTAHPELPVIFIFNAESLKKLQLSARRLGFYLETLQELAQRRDLSVYLGDPYKFGNEEDVAVTFAPVPSFRKFENVAEIHPYPWLVEPFSGSLRSYSSWRSKVHQ